jgi:RNA polymerase sigma-70 factor (ECF subfamily)
MMAADLPDMQVAPFRAQRVLSNPASEIPDAQHWARLMVAVATRRDVASFMRIYDYYAPRLQRYLLGRGVNAAQAEELVQESLLRLWRRAELFDPRRASLATWLFRIARNLHLDSVRGEPQWLSIEEGFEALEAESAGNAQTTEAGADYAGLQQAIDGLPASQARLIRMSYFEARSHSEIARELAMPLGSVKSALRRAFAKLQAGLGGMP